MKLQRITNRLASIATTRLPVLEAKAGTTQRIRGTSWMNTRQRIMRRDNYTCAGCGLGRMDHQVDQVVPLEQAGSNEDCNLQLLCATCHDVKTAHEAQSRAGKRPGGALPNSN
jgi:5-methylcytosine-specific restriction enzyme A